MTGAELFPDKKVKRLIIGCFHIEPIEVTMELTAAISSEPTLGLQLSIAS